MKTIATLFATAVLSLSAMAAPAVLVPEDIGFDVPVDVVEKNKVTQVIVADSTGTYVMATEQEVVDTVLVTPEMANNAIAYHMTQEALPTVFSVDQAANSGNSDGTTTPFTKLGRMEPIATMTTEVKKVYFQYGNDVYAFETTGEVGNTVTLSRELIAMSTKQ